ncbi:MAG: ATP-dependent DNA helicase RecG [Solirubrobacteraceae bacterium]|jgi:ATP-dependent DNA helicase RecG
MSPLVQLNLSSAAEPDSGPAAGATADTGAGPRAFASEERPTRREWLGAPVHWPRPSRLRQDLTTALDIAPGRMADGLGALGLTSVGTLLEHLPRDSRDARTVKGLRPGEAATIAVQVRTIGARPVRRRGMKPLVQASVFDETGSIHATFFNQPWLAQRYTPGTRLVLHGKTTDRGTFNVVHHALGSDVGANPGAGGLDADEAQAPGQIAHYTATDGVSSTQILTLVRSAKSALADVPEVLSAATRVREQLPDRASALGAMHFARTPEEREAGRERLAFEELLLTQLAFLRRRARRRVRGGAPALNEPPSLSERWCSDELPFALTGDQRRAIETIGADLAQERAMQRLLLGEVGSGKTVVAVWALLRAIEHGMQAALMAPTETLAEQHFATLQTLLGGMHGEVRCALLTGSTPASKRADTLGKLAGGELSLLVGTHALIEPDVRFRSLAVAVVDEQHRFGVRQRAALDGKGVRGGKGQAGIGDGTGGAVHVLHMTATPIPRTLALANYGDLDTTMLRELPRGRRPIDTRIVSGESERAQAYDELREQLRAGRQAYVVCPLIEDAEESRPAGEGAQDDGSGASDMRAATAELQRLRTGELQHHRLVLLHGGMRSREKARAMAEFASGQADVLVATTVIEVGIDVPNATVMVIENAERFGISQLHQLRGRIGRGEHRSVCLLMGPSGAARLRALAEHANGFELAEIDLRLRKEGELIGVRQSGLGQFQIATLPDDAPLLERARACAETIVARDPQLREPEHVLLGEELERAFGSQAHDPIPG